MSYGIGDIPILGDIHKGIFGDPDAVKEAYDKQIEASKVAQAQMQQFLMGQKGQAQAIYSPMKHMYQSLYGTEGMMAPQIPGQTMSQMQQAAALPAPDPGRGAMAPAPGKGRL